ncbi:MAG TPA: MerR family transcriptional regulator [Actinomycetota bacterium]|jgi:MerR family transcriptional regulator/heat shock protein HspR|nr:MerR family transcriptional regulator [Actinomycetota bacterium]
MYIISVAAELAGVHPQTLRVYERKGLLTPQRTQGNTRRYSPRDIQLLRRIQELTNEGINLAGVVRILELETEIERLHARQARAVREIAELETQLTEVFEAQNRTALVPFKDVRRIRRAMRTDDIDEATRPRIFQAPPIS